MTKISGVIITYNEQDNVGPCIDSMAPVADEIVVVDSYSSDDTKSICNEKGVKFFEHDFEGHIQQKNYALSLTSHDVVLSLDADERLSPALQDAIINIKDDKIGHAYKLNRLTNYCGKWIRHCGWYPDAKVRLWNKTAGSWGGENPHDIVILNDTISAKSLRGDILHYSFPTIQSHLDTIAKFSDIAAGEVVAKNKQILFLIHVVLNPFFTFFQKYFLQLGFLDGRYGFIICALSAYANLAKYAKIWTLKRTR